MHILIAPDSFKDALSANEVAIAMDKGLRMVSPSFTTTLLPLADGGEGSSAILCSALVGEWLSASCTDAHLRPCTGHYAWLPQKKLAIIELAQAAGLQQLAQHERNPLHTSTYGLGLLMKDALARGAEEIMLTLGGSATHDCGTGMLAALGWRFFAESTQIDQPAGADLERITSVLPPAEPLRFRCSVLCDVQSVLAGKQGAAHTYAKQKGASIADIETLERGTQSFAAIADAHANKRLSLVNGTGAAGGTGYGAMAYLGAQLRPGAEEVLRVTGFEAMLDQADAVLTGEGCFDGQTEQGKLISAIASKCKDAGKPLFVLCGLHKASVQQQEAMGIAAVLPLGNGARTLRESIAHTSADLQRVAYQLGRTFMALNPRPHRE